MSEKKGGNCWNCGAELSAMDYGRGDSCPQCGRDTKVCKNCEFYAPSYNNSCRENQAERVVDKERSNFCDYFIPRALNFTGGDAARDAARAAAEALFRKK